MTLTPPALFRHFDLTNVSSSAEALPNIYNLLSVIQSVEPYVSSEDIDKGARWSTDIAKELDASSYGILCVTTDNLESPWLNFEAGALSKSFDKSNVSPFLFNQYFPYDHFFGSILPKSSCSSNKHSPSLVDGDPNAHMIRFSLAYFR